MRFIETKVPGYYEIYPQVVTNSLGSFVKTFHQELFRERCLETHFVEEYFSVSKKRVLREVHSQLPLRAHVKLVYCIDGEVLDVLVDLRICSTCHGKDVGILWKSFNVWHDENSVLSVRDQRHPDPIVF